ncbi:MAG: UPF0182 family protein [Candidatus Hydrothermarchaeota archaeon]|nr:UPF0182 family protein [Candidatus Hydrothermarchaeota archaeon]
MKWLGYLLGIVVALSLFAPALAGFYTEYLWFVEVGYLSVFLTVLKSKFVLAAIAAAFFFVFGFLNFRLVLKNSLAMRGEGSEFRFASLAFVLVLLFSLLMGFSASTGWDVTLRYLNQVPFGSADPIFNKDISFYFFTLPFYQFVLAVLFFGVAALTLIISGIYLLFGGFIVLEGRGEIPSTQMRFEMPRFSKEAMAHLLALGSLILILKGFGYVLDRYSILYSARGAVYGAGYADVNIQLPFIGALVVASFVAALGFLIAAKTQNIKFALGVALVVVLSILSGFAQGIVQQYRVSPDEYNIEKPYLEHNIKFTRAAYDLDSIREIEFPANYDLTIEDINRNRLTIDNIRLWDWRPLKRTYVQVQLIRTYYDFSDVDIDRYSVNGEYRQVMLSGREINVKLLPERTWVNEHLVFTHGYGAAMSPVREVSKEGLPVFYIQDVPPKSEFFEITRPEIYFGELTENYVLVKTKTEEFDYPKGDENVYTTYQGSGGIELSSLTRKAAMAARFSTLKLFVSESITPESRIIFYRNIKDRVNNIAPFLSYDEDPYIVVSDGRLFWIQDAYTVSDRYPYSEPYNRINYIRNSVKVVIDAYDGETNFYVVDEKDPLIKVYMKIFPELFKPFSAMPQNLMEHVRYPEGLFSIQVAKYSTYHMNEARVFYNKEDVWEVPEELYEGTRIKMEPYYLITKLPGEAKEEFILLLPFTPREKNNMIAWLAARSDQPHYGEKIVYMFPKDKLVYGPIQIEARIDQDPDISQLFTLWSQAGTRVIRGNLLTIPIKDSLLYVEPIYLRAEQKDALPQLKRVIIIFGDRLTMQETLEKSLSVIFGEVPEEVKPPTLDEEKLPAVDEALQQYEKARAELEKLREVLEGMKKGQE